MMTSDSLVQVAQAILAGFVAGIVLYTLQVIWQIKKDYLILVDRVRKLEEKVENSRNTIRLEKCKQNKEKGRVVSEDEEIERLLNDEELEKELSEEIENIEDL